MRLFKIALPILFVAGLAVAAGRAWTERSDKAARALAAEHARSEFVQRAALVRAQPDPERYRGELKALLRTWFASQTTLRNRWPLLRDELAPYVARMSPPAALAGEIEELAGGELAALREGRVEPLLTAPAEGLRLEVLRAQRKGAGDDARLAVDVAVWGAPEETVGEDGEGRATFRTTVALLFRGLSLRYFDAAGKEIAHLDGEGQPRLRIDLPEGLFADAPPGLVLGRYEPFLFPKGAAEVEWTLAVQSKLASGETREVKGVWRTKMDPAWCDGTGKVWNAADTVAVEAPEEPAKGKQQAARR